MTAQEHSDAATTIPADMRAVLDAAAKARIGQPAFFEQSADDVRAWMRRRFTPYWNRNPVPLARVEALMLPGGAGPLPARLYDPGVTAPAPALLWLHGGGWTLGDLDSHDGLCRRLAALAGCRVVALDYRLAPEHPFPAAFDDACASVDFLVRHGAALGLDPVRLVVGGDSAGANLALAAIRAARDADAPLPAGLALVYGAYRFDLASPSWQRCGDPYFLLGRDDTAWFWANYLPPDYVAGNDWRIEPGLGDLAGLPPVWVAVGDHDPLWDDNVALARDLERAGTTCTFDRWPGLVHGAALFFDAVDGAVLGLERLARWLRAICER